MVVKIVLTSVGPEIRFGPRERAVRLGDALELVCGTGLESNPPATITWRDPTGVVVMDNARYTLINNANGVVLGFTNTISSDMGNWTCEVRVDGVNVITTNGGTADIMIGREVNTIFLSIVGEPI